MEFFYLLNAVMLVRLFFFFRDEKLTLKKLTWLLILQIIFFIPFEINLKLLLFTVFIIGINISFYFWEKKSESLNLMRTLSFLFNLVLIGLFTSASISMNFNQGLIGSIQNIGNYIFIFSRAESLDWLTINIVIMGILILLNEVNFIIRYLFELFSLVPKLEAKDSSAVDEREYNAGRVIGMLERILILFFVLINQFAAIGFIIAAKGFTRFKELDRREFAEYVLIGTLLSALLAIAVAYIVKLLLM